jgi:hypothetical protein
MVIKVKYQISIQGVVQANPEHRGELEREARRPDEVLLVQG